MSLLLKCFLTCVKIPKSRLDSTSVAIHQEKPICQVYLTLNKAQKDISELLNISLFTDKPRLSSSRERLSNLVKRNVRVNGWSWISLLSFLLNLLCNHPTAIFTLANGTRILHSQPWFSNIPRPLCHIPRPKNKWRRCTPSREIHKTKVRMEKMSPRGHWGASLIRTSLFPGDLIWGEKLRQSGSLTTRD